MQLATGNSRLLTVHIPYFFNTFKTTIHMDYELVFQMLPPSKSHPGCTIRIKILFVCLLNTFVMLHLMKIKLRNKVVAALTISLDKQPI